MKVLAGHFAFIVVTSVARRRLLKYATWVSRCQRVYESIRIKHGQQHPIAFNDENTLKIVLLQCLQAQDIDCSNKVCGGKLWSTRSG